MIAEHLARQLRNIDGDLVSSLDDQRPGGLQRSLDDRRWIERHALDLDLALGDPRQIEQVVDQLGELLGLALHDAKRVTDLGPVVASEPGNVDRDLERCQRISQLMRQRGQELVLALVGLEQR